MNAVISNSGQGYLRLALQALPREAVAWLQSPPFAVAAADTAYVVMRMRHHVRIAAGALWLRNDSVVPGVATAAWPAGSYVVRDFDLVADGSWTTYAVPVAAERDFAPATATTTNVTHLRLLPAASSPSYGTVDIDWVRIVHAPTLLRVQGCAALGDVAAAVAAGTPGAPPAVDPAVVTPADQYLRWHASGANSYWSDAAALAAGIAPAWNDSFPISSTYGCAPLGGEVLLLTGHHLGSAAAVPTVTVAGAPCVNVTWRVPGRQLTCISPPAPATGGTGRLPVTVRSATHPLLDDTEDLLAYDYPVDTLAAGVTNVGAHALDVNVLHASPWQSIVTTGYAVTATPVVAGGGVVTAYYGNTSVLTLRALARGTTYTLTVCAMAYDVAAQAVWWSSDAYRRVPAALASAPGTHVVACAPPVTASTLAFDFVFAGFPAASLLDAGPAVRAPSTNSLAWAGGEGHYGLQLVGAASVANGNATHVCCDGFAQGGLEAATGALLAGAGDEWQALWAWEPATADFSTATNATAAAAAVAARLASLSVTAGSEDALWQALAPRLWTQHHPVQPWPGWDDTGGYGLVNASAYAAVVAAWRAAEAAQRRNVTRMDFIVGRAPQQQLPVDDERTRGIFRDGAGRVLLPLLDATWPPARTCAATAGAAASLTVASKLALSRAAAVVEPVSPDTNTLAADYDRSALVASWALQGITGRPPTRHAGDFAAVAANGMVVMRGSAINGSAAISSSAAANSRAPSPRRLPVTAPCGPALRLTPAGPDATGAAWYGRPQQVREGFDTTFVWRAANGQRTCNRVADDWTSCETRGGAGFAFVVQAGAGDALGRGGVAGAGYDGLRRALLAVEFDSHYDAEGGEPYANHISVHVPPPLGSAAGGVDPPLSYTHNTSLGAAAGDTVPDLTTGIHIARIVYTPQFADGVVGTSGWVPDAPALLPWLARATLSGVAPPLGTLAVYIDDADTPALVVPVPRPLTSVLDASHGRAWVGFTASTGSDIWQTHDILAWTFRSLRLDEPATPAV